MRGGSTIIIAAVLALGVAPAGAGASSRNAAATHAYIEANYKLARAAEASVAPAQAKVEALDEQLGRECPKVGKGGPEDEESGKISHEATEALWSISYGTGSDSIQAFAKTVSTLKWSNPNLTSIARHYAKTLEGLAALPLPNLCENVREWATSDFKTIPATTLQLDAQAEALEGHTIPAKLLAPYERPSDRSIVAQTARLETKLERTETVVGFSDWDMLLETLGLNQ
ncbi:MAG TPA: hypothetical protein VGL54_11445 [Solirubrobacteraceae bacterium]|jgi:hypothetical protein